MGKVSDRVMLGVSMAAGAVGGAVVSFLLTGTPVVAQESSKAGAKVVTAEEFRLVDVKGRTRALLSFSEDGEPFFHLRDENDFPRVWLGVSTETGMAVRDVDGTTRIVLSVEPDGDPSLVLRDRQHKTKSVHP